MAFNFHPYNSHDGRLIEVDEEGEYKVILSSDDYCFGGQGRIWHQTYKAEKQEDGKIGFKIYLPSRTAVVLRKIQKRRKEEK